MRVLAIVNALGRGGAELSLLRLAAAAREQGVEIVVLPLRADASLAAELAAGGIAERVRVLRPGVVSLANGWMKGGFDVVEGWMYGGAVASIAFERRAPVVWNLHHVPSDLSLESANTRRALWTLARFGAPARIHVNSASAISAHRALGIEGDYRSICIGIDTERFRPCEELREATRASIGLASDAQILLHVARFHPHKGHARSVAAFARIASDLPRAQLICVGEGSENVIALARTAGVAARVRALPAVSNVIPLYAACDAVVSPSWTESFPTVVAEAMSCARACVVTDVGASALIVGDTGTVVREASVEALAQAYADALEWSPQERADRGQRARARVVAMYSAAAMTSGYVASLRELIGSKG